MKKLIFLILLIPGFCNAQILRLAGIADPPPATITPSGGLTNFTNVTGTPSASQSFTFTAAQLVADVVWTAGSGMEVSTNNSTWLGFVTYTKSGTTASGTVYTRVAGATGPGTLSGNISGTSTSAGTALVPYSATVSSLPFLTITGTFSAFSSTAGSPSTAQTVTASGSGLTNNCVINWPTGFEGSLNGTTYSTTQTISQSSGSLISQPVTVYTRIAASASGNPSGNVAFTSTGATTVNKAATGTVTPSSSFAYWNFSQTSLPTTGSNNVFGIPNNGQTATDATTGWTLSTVAGAWDVFAGSIYGSNGDGASSGTFGPVFTALMMRGTYINITKFIASPSNYNIVISNLPPGNYQMDLIGSIKSSVIASGTVEYDAVFGTGSNVQKLLNVQDNTQTIVTWTGTITTGQTIQLGIFQPAGGSPAFGIVNAVKLTKL